MSYEERGQWVYVIVTVVAVAIYVVLLVAGAGGGPLTEVDYVPILLWTIGAGVVGAIIGRILAAIIWQGEGHETDVRDRDIDRRGEYIGGLVLGIGMARTRSRPSGPMGAIPSFSTTWSKRSTLLRERRPLTVA